MLEIHQYLIHLIYPKVIPLKLTLMDLNLWNTHRYMLRVTYPQENTHEPTHLYLTPVNTHESTQLSIPRWKYPQKYSLRLTMLEIHPYIIHLIYPQGNTPETYFHGPKPLKYPPIHAPCDIPPRKYARTYSLVPNPSKYPRIYSIEHTPMEILPDILH